MFWVRFIQLLLSLILAILGIFAPQALISRFTEEHIIAYVVAATSILLLNIVVEQFIIAHRLGVAKRAVDRSVGEIQVRLGQLIHAIDIDPNLMRFRDMAKRLLAHCGGLDFAMHEWLLTKAEGIVLERHYKEQFGDEVGLDEERARIKVLTQVLLHARHSIAACTYADADHLRIFRANDSAGYIHSHAEALRRNPRLNLKRIFIVPGDLPTDASRSLLHVVHQFLAEGITQNFWIPEDTARKIFKPRADIRFPSRGFFLADQDHEAPQSDERLAFVSEGLSHDENGRVKDRPYFIFTRNSRSLTPFAEQFELLMDEAKDRQLSSNEDVKPLMVYLGLAQNRAPRG